MKIMRIGTSHASIDIKWHRTNLPQTQTVTSTNLRAALLKHMIYSLFICLNKIWL